MRAIWKGTISFGLVNIPVALGIATQRSDPKFRTLDAKTLQPIKQQLYSPARDEVISRDETVKGYEVAKDRFVVLTEEELESVAVERRRTIDILSFVDAAEVDPVYYDRTYYLMPQEGAEKPYALLLEALAETGKAAIGKLVLSGKEHLVLLRPSGRTLAIELLFYPEDVRSKAEIEERMEGVKTTKAELEMAKQLVESLSEPFDPSAYENEHKRELMQLIERKQAGEVIEVPAEAPRAATPAPDLMSALKASLEQAKKADGGAKRKRRASANGAAKKAPGKRRATKAKP
jgi:DNA end-binding protein Ku